MSDLYYLQDSRTFVGNDVMWWAKDGNGYTTDLRKAHIYTKEEAVRQHQSRETDIPWPKDYIDARTRPAVDMQYINRKEELKGTGIKLIKPQRPKAEVYNCVGCGRFISDVQRYLHDCHNGGASNRP